jgi:redox-sensing transcriptional repressor
MNKLPGKTVERLSEYRRQLLGCLAEKMNYIYSHDLAALLHITIGRIIDSEEGLNVAIIGIGNLGRAVTGYFRGKRSKLNVVASFDNDPQKVNKVISGVKCYHTQDMEKIIREMDIRIAILTIPADYAKSMVEEVVRYGIKGILNFTTVPLNVPSEVHLEEYDMITSMEKVAYFIKDTRV